jgi:hypothetical protein
MSILHKNFTLPADSLKTDGSFEGYASTFGNKDHHGDIVERGAFTESLQNRTPKMFYNHGSGGAPIGVWDSASEDEKGLYVKGRLFIDGDHPVQRAREVYRGIKEGVIDKMSIGYRVIESRRDKALNAERLEVVELFEISVVDFPANDAAGITAVKNIQTEREIEQALRDAGLSSASAVTAVSVFKTTPHWARDALGDDAEKGSRDADELEAKLTLALARVKHW